MPRQDKELHWYAADLLERPQDVDFDSWDEQSPAPPLPDAFPTRSDFWDGFDTVGLTGRP